MAKITYENKETLNAQPSIADKNKVSSNDMNEIKTVVNNNDDTLNAQGTLITNITGTILWTNSNPTGNFNPQNITLSSSDYDMLEIFYIDYQSTKRMMSVRAIKQKNILLNSLFIFNNGLYMGERPITYTNATTLSVEDCKKIIDNNSIITPANANNWLIPQYIIGYKTGLFN